MQVSSLMVLHTYIHIYISIYVVLIIVDAKSLEIIAVMLYCSSKYCNTYIEIL